MSETQIVVQMPGRDVDWRPGMRTEWRDGVAGSVQRGVLIEPDGGVGGPWWLVDVDGQDERSLVKTWALHPEGGIRREEIAKEVHGVLRRAAYRRHDMANLPPWADALAVADAVIAMDAEPT
jgi:hypothetical protein